MKDQHLEQHELLLKEKEQLQSELSDIASFNATTGMWEVVPENQDAGPEADFNDLADRIEDFEERGSTVSALSARLKSVEQALEKLESNTFGVCRVCVNKIEAERIEANPAAPTCKEHINE
jgi:RNA polymerase-binding transcription factor DksA